MPITKFWLATIIVAAVALSAGVATADHVFDDVDDGRFFAIPAEWAERNGITNGCGNGNFCPNDPVTRGENVTFAKRYDDNVVQPALQDIDERLDALEQAQADQAGLLAVGRSEGSTFSGSSWVQVDTDQRVTVTVPTGRTGRIHALVTSLSVCYFGDANGDWCALEMRLDGEPIATEEQRGFFDSTNNGAESIGSGEHHAMQRVTDTLGPGTYEVTVHMRSNDGSSTMILDETVVTAVLFLD